MSRHTYRIKIVALMLLSSSIVQAMTFDNRYFPLLQHPYVTVECRPSHANIDLFVTTGNKAFSNNNDDEVIGIPEIYGLYDERDLANALVAIGKPNPIRTGLQGIELPWNVQGKIQSQGVAVGGQLQITPHFSCGFTWFVMQSNSRQEFYFKHKDLTQLTAAEELELEALRRLIHAELGLEGPFARQSGGGDVDLYVRLNNWWEYIFKFKKIDAGIRLGAIFPSGEPRNINNPASVPFGGDGHYGIYGALDAEFELKEDWKVGWLLRVNKRLSRTKIERMPVGEEPYVYGPIVGPALVSPACTFIMSPYASFENLREGMGARVQYTLELHGEDCWQDRRADKTIPVNLRNVTRLSRWGADYITLTVFYDFGKVKVAREFEPVVSFAWDVPVSFMASRGNCKTNRFALSVECNF